MTCDETLRLGTLDCVVGRLRSGSEFTALCYGGGMFKASCKTILFTRRALACAIALVLWCACSCPADPIYAEPADISSDIPGLSVYHSAGPAQVRRTDGYGTTWAENDPDPIDLGSFLIGLWNPDDPSVDLYDDGAYDPQGQFLRIDLLFRGVVNPPGPTSTYLSPNEYGDRPVYGWLELDADNDVDTGGEVAAPEFRYNGAVCRFGGVPTDAVFENRLSFDGLNSDLVFGTAPLIDRSGEDFHLSLLGNNVQGIVEIVGDGDLTFEAGEDWLVLGSFFHRAHGYRDITFGGAYEPVGEIRFRHDTNSSSTSVTLVFPMTNEAYALAHGGEIEENDGYALNAYSVFEALLDLNLSSVYGAGGNHEYAGLIAGWAGDDAVVSAMSAQNWRPTCILGTVLPNTADGASLYTYTDAWPGVVGGDFNSDGQVTSADHLLVDAFIADHDNDPLYDQDGMLNGLIELANFGPRFSVFDVDYDGIVGLQDVKHVQIFMGDFDDSGTIDLLDYIELQVCAGYQAGSLPEAMCMASFDLNGDEQIDLEDYQIFHRLMRGP